MKPKLDTTIVVAKGACFVLIGAGTPMASSLAQWANSGQWPEPIHWVGIIIGAVVGGASALLSYLSGAYTDYLKGRSGGSTDTTTFMAGRLSQPTPHKD